MAYNSNAELPGAVQKLPDHAQDIFREAFNATLEQTGDEARAFAVAWAAVRRVYRQTENGEWVRKKSSRIGWRGAQSALERGNSAMLEYKAFQFDYQADETRIVEGHAAVFGNIDSGNGFFRDVIHPGAFKDALADSRQRKRIRYLWNHDYDLPPLGPILGIAEDSTGLQFKARLTEGVPLADQVYLLLREKALDELSIGFQPVDWKMDQDANVGPIRHLLRITPYDVSHVNLGMNPEAQVMSVKAGLMNMEFKGAIPFHSYPLADKDTPWDAGPEIKGATPEELMKMCAWYDEANPDLRGSYKLPHHLRNGYKTVWRGVANAMARLMQANTDIPESDRPGVYRHLARHYREFDEEPPELKDYSRWSELEIKVACRDYDLFDLLEYVNGELKSGHKVTATSAQVLWDVTRSLLASLDCAGYIVPSVAEQLQSKAQQEEEIKQRSQELAQRLQALKAEFALK